jgi:hypothetical protein
MRKITISLLAILLISSVYGAIENDKVTSLPDVAPLSSNWYSGYLTVSDSK